MPETNMTVPQKNLKNVIKAGSCLDINHAINDRYVALS